jgi:Leucine-rich repeat (LRR) protein
MLLIQATVHQVPFVEYYSNKLERGKKVRQHKKTAVLLLLLGLISFSCNLLVWNGDPPPIENVLQKKDSLAVRAILDQNGLYSTKVLDVINLQNNIVGSIMIKSLPLTRLVLTRSIDSLLNGFRINVINCTVDTLVIVDEISNDLGLGMNNTNIRSIPASVALLKGNLYLYFSQNKISSLPNEIMKCKIGYINLQYNRLCSVSDTFNSWIIENSRDPDWKVTQMCN